MNDYTSGEEEYNRYIGPITIVSRVVSIWPLNDDHSSIEKYLRVCHRIAMIVMGAIMATAATVDGIRLLDELDEATECILIGSAFYLSVVREINYTIHEKDLRYIVETMRNDWIVATPVDRIVLKEKCHLSYMLAKQFILTVALALMLFTLGPALDIILLNSDERILPFRGYFSANQTSSPYYECLYVSTAIAGLLCGCTIASATSLNLVATMHGAARFGILQRRLESIKSTDPDCNGAMIDCIKRHQSAIEFADALERMINVLALGQFAISTGLVCFAGFQITAMIEDKSRLMKYCSFLNSAILELFLFSFSGQHLIDESEAVADSAYMADWYGGTFSKSLRILMMRASVPSKITAAKFYDMSLPSFSSVLSTSFSYFTVLQAMNEE